MVMVLGIGYWVMGNGRNYEGRNANGSPVFRNEEDKQEMTIIIAFQRILFYFPVTFSKLPAIFPRSPFLWFKKS